MSKQSPCLPHWGLPLWVSCSGSGLSQERRWLALHAPRLAPRLSDDHLDNSKRKGKNSPQGVESEGASCCERSVRVLCDTTNFLCPLLHQPACASSRHPRRTRPSFLKGLCLRAHTGGSPFSYHVTRWHAAVCPTVSCKKQIFQ